MTVVGSRSNLGTEAVKIRYSPHQQNPQPPGVALPRARSQALIPLPPVQRFDRERAPSRRVSFWMAMSG